MEGKNPVILSSDPKVKEMFRKMIADTTDAIIGSYDDNTAYSGKNVYELRKSLEDLGFLPDQGLGFDKTLETVRKEIMPHLLRTWSTMYMPHLHAPALTETIASELIIGTFNDSMDSWDQGPAATEIEEDMVHGLVRLFGLGSGADGTFTSGGTQSNMAALIAARDWYCNRKHGCDVKKEGLPPFYGKMRLYTSEVSHFSMEKSCHVMGLGYNSVRKLPVDSKCKVDIKKFDEMVQQDIKDGLLPFCAVATLHRKGDYSTARHSVHGFLKAELCKGIPVGGCVGFNGLGNFPQGQGRIRLQRKTITQAGHAIGRNGPPGLFLLFIVQVVEHIVAHVALQVRVQQHSLDIV